MPCLNEAETLARCIEKAQVGIENSGVLAEIVVADNSSKDDSVQIAKRLGARVVHVKERGYGNALRGGIQAASGKWIVMGDADESYDFSETDRFVKKFQEGFELVNGCRMPQGGGKILPGAMPFSHRWLGNPLFSRMARHMFAAPIHEFIAACVGSRGNCTID
jgi:glycosyltransferase involved in cell wall biosynthesis